MKGLPKYLESKVKELIKCCTKALQTQVDNLETSTLKLVALDNNPDQSEHADLGYLQVANISQAIEAGTYKLSWNLSIFNAVGGSHDVKIDQDNGVVTTLLEFSDTKATSFPYSGFLLITIPTATTYDFSLEVGDGATGTIVSKDHFLILEQL